MIEDSFMNKTCKIKDAVKIIEADDNIKKMLFKYALVQGRVAGIYKFDYSLKSINANISGVIKDSLNDLKKILAKDLSNIVNLIQENLKIGDDFFSYNIDDDKIYVFDEKYNEIINGKYKLTSDYSKLIMPIENEV
ncbi:hypothetical protein [Clostridium felsineum]|uniref:hypothetical protein n=1 Tax=Clostridium felsineum TaxID=36839 RepID=UPI00098C6F5F|nr:hypothetical protein [Clostridium felsineum]URZ16359.1 hypothetical protein CLFE_024060 [Clostridium felsineum DSM 794]